MLDERTAEILAQEHMEQIGRIQEMHDHLITPDGKARPGVTREQLINLIKVTREVRAIQQKTLKDLEEFGEFRKEFDEELKVTQDLMLSEEKKSGNKFSSLIRKMFRLE